jgi:RNA polymerase sigma factor (sigma-70 family)
MENGLLQPLRSEGRFRETHVEQQVQSLLHSDMRSIRSRIAIRDRGAKEWVQEETLVCLLRILHRKGDREGAWQVAEMLVERVAGFLSRHISLWHLAPHHAEECARDVQDQLLIDLFNEKEQAEFYEVRFWLCLKRRLLNVIQRYRRVGETELLSSSLHTSDEDTEDTILRLPDQSALSLQIQAEVVDALATLKVQERAAFVLYHKENWSQIEIAERLQVSERTVRNLLTRAEKRLSEWRGESEIRVGGAQ